jgi:hypothetical protein
MSIVANEMKSEYKKYLNKIDNKKQCKKMTFKQFIDNKLGKKTSRKNKKSSTSKNKPAVVIAEPQQQSNNSEETPVFNELPPELSTSPQSEPSTSVNSEEQLSTLNEAKEEESKPKSIVETVSDALGISRKEGGKKKHKSRSRK